MTSYVTDGTVGPWAKEKLECLGKYLHAYTTILKSQTWCDGFIYVDAFAGAGKAPLRRYDKKTLEGGFLSDIASYINEEEVEAKSYIHGSPKVALSIRHPFTEYIFIEKDQKRINELKELRDEYGDQRKIIILEGDANVKIQEYFLANDRYNWRKIRALAFLDPFGMQVPWETIERIGRTKAIELILNLPVGMAIQRLLPKSGKFQSEHKEKLTDYFGCSEWEDIIYEHQDDLFGAQKVKKDDAGKHLAKWYQKRLKDVYGYSSKPRLIKNTRGAHLYYLLWAGPNETGSKIAGDVLRQGEVA